MEQPKDDGAVAKGPRSRAPTPLFSTLVDDLLVPLSRLKARPGVHQEKPRERRWALLNGFMSQWRRDVGDDFYPALRLLLPDLDSDRVYNLKEQTIGPLLAKAVGIGKHSDDVKGLDKWKHPRVFAAEDSTAADSTAGDFSARCRDVVKKREISPGRLLRIEQVNDLLDRLARARREEDRLAVFQALYEDMSAEELQWVVRVVLKDLGIGVGRATILEAWHPDAEALFRVCTSLRRVCRDLHDPERRLEAAETDIVPMRCFKPQLARLCENSSGDAIEKAMKGAEFWIEPKLDGERMQLHLDDGAFCFWSRTGKDYTYLYGKGYEHGALTPYLRDAFPDARSLVLDGEMITWDDKTKEVVHFGTLKTAALTTRENPYQDGRRPFFQVFDVLHVNGTPINRYTLQDRFNALRAFVRPVPGRLEILEHEVATSPGAVSRALEKVVASASEGLVLKNPQSMYRPDDRTKDWIKVKPDYVGELGDSLDCVVIGAYYGTGHRGGKLSSFLCGLRADGTAETCLSFFKVGDGFSASDYTKIDMRTYGKWVDWDEKRPPKFVRVGRDDAPDVWIRPSESVVLSVKANSIIPSSATAALSSLRFPRLERVRLDRTWDSALTMKEFEEFWRRMKEEGPKATKEHASKAKDKHTSKKAKLGHTVISDDADETAVVRDVAAAAAAAIGSTIFASMTFFIPSRAATPLKMPKEELYALVKNHGGKITSKAGAGVVCIADRKVVEVAARIKAKDTDIIKPQWLHDCVSQSGGPSLLPYEERHLFYAREPTRALAKMSVDRHGDPYYRDTTPEDLQKIMKKMDEAGTMKNIDEGGENSFALCKEPQGPKIDGDIAADRTELQHMLDSTPGLARNVFRKCHVHFHAGAGTSVDFLKTQLSYYVWFGGGTVADRLANGNGITHVVVVEKDPNLEVEKAKEALSAIATWGVVPRVVGHAWVLESWKERTQLNEDTWVPRASRGGVGTSTV